MRMKLAKAIVCGLSLVCLGCSWITRFYIVNRTTGPVRVEYSARRAFPKPVIVSIENLKSNEIPKAPAADPRISESVSDSGSIYTIMIPPDSAAAIYEGGSYTQPPDYPNSELRGLRLDIQTDHGRATYLSGAILTAFHKVRNNTYALDVQ